MMIIVIQKFTFLAPLHDKTLVMCPSITDSWMTIFLSAEERLVADLFANHQDVSTWARPVADATQPVMVTFTAVLYQLLHVDEKQQLIQLFLWENLVSLALLLVSY